MIKHTTPLKRSLSALLSATFLVSNLVDAAPAGKKPNVLLFFSDQHQAACLGVEGHPDVITPNLDKLAAGGVRFTRAYCNDAICTPSRMSLMSGLYPRTLGCLDNGDRTSMMDKVIPLAQAFKSAGYVTAAFGKRHTARGVDAGWDLQRSHLDNESPGGGSYVQWINDQGYGREFAEDWAAEFGKGPGGSPFSKTNIPTAKMGTRPSKLPEDKTMEAFTAEETIKLIKAQKTNGQPFFCWSSFYRPHQPYTPLPRYLAMYDTSKWGKGTRAKDGIKMPSSLEESVKNLPPELAQRRLSKDGIWCLELATQDEQLYRDYLGAYYALVTEIDHHVGQIMKALEAEGLLENTIIIYTSDHGDFVGNHGLIEKSATGHNVYEDTLRVPLIVYWKGKTKVGLATDDLAQLADLYPTLMQLCGIVPPKQPAAYAGTTLAPLLMNGKPLGREYIVSENWSQTTIVGKRFKFGRMNDTDKTIGKRNFTGFGDMMFDRQNDPLELTNIVAVPKYAFEKEKLQKQLAQWEQQFPGEARKEVYLRH
jgi:arylsulfatase A-like enzyme